MRKGPKARITRSINSCKGRGLGLPQMIRETSRFARILIIVSIALFAID